jgi:hypothetical protein
MDVGLPAVRQRVGRRAPGRIDGRSAVAKRIRARIAGFTGVTGGVASPEDIRRVAELVTLAERARLGALTGRVNPDTLVRVENAAMRAIKALRLRPAPSFDEALK